MEFKTYFLNPHTKAEMSRFLKSVRREWWYLLLVIHSTLEQIRSPACFLFCKATLGLEVLVNFFFFNYLSREISERSQWKEMFLNIHITSNSPIDPEIGEYIEIKITEHIQYCILMLSRKAKLSGNWVVEKCWNLEIGYAHLIPFPNKALSHILNKSQ